MTARERLPNRRQTRPVTAAVSIKIANVITADDPLGPWPPSLAGNWHVARSCGGFTLWRQISLATEGAGNG